MRQPDFCCRALGVLLVSLFPISCGFLPKRASDIRQAIWVTRWDYKTERDVREVVQNCARGGFDTILFQVRGNGTVSYRSRIEPWSEVYGFRDPGFDPLAAACDEARKQGVSVQAWVNATPGWRGDRAPKDVGQLYHTRPEWFVVDQHKSRQPLRKDRYLWLNPCLPQVRDYIASICEEIALNYPVAGIHLDYIRLPDPEGDLDFPYDDTTLELFRQATGAVPDQSPADWHAWRTDCVTGLVREIKRRVRRAGRRCLVTAAVYRTPEKARQVFQDWVTWLDRGYVDAVFPMTYDEQDQRFRATLAVQKEASAGGPVIVGIGTYKHEDPAQTLRQMDNVRQAGMQGYCVFAYSSLFPSRANAGDAENAAKIRENRHDQILPRVRADRIERHR